VARIGCPENYRRPSEVNVSILRILIVDDSPAMRSFIRRVIELCDFDACEFLEAENGQRALELIQHRHPNIVLTDINMPVMNGEEMLEKLAACDIPSKPPVVVISTDSTQTRMDRMRQLGATAYLRKPFTPEDMRAVFQSTSFAPQQL
jgi:two-component system chemotaxis response regulator CheY